MYFFSRCVVVLLCFLYSLGAIAKDDYAIKFIAEHGYDKAVAQLFVTGIPADYKNKYGNPDITELFADIGVGGAMLNKYNVPAFELKKDDDRDASINSVRDFIGYIKSRSAKSSGYPAVIYADYESDEFSSVQYPLLSPPNPLVLASSGNTKYSHVAGRTAAYQLKGIGVDAIFGPVFDLDHCAQGIPNHSISLRVFSGSRKIMTPYVRAYLKGMSEVGVYTFAKHFPSYSHVYKNAHKENTIYAASEDNIKRDLQSFKELNGEYDGIMTSHLTVKVVDEKTPVTYSRDFIESFIKNKKEIDGKLLITDDLSNMKAAKEYIADRYTSFSYKNSALHAFKAGHDLLLFSHISGRTGRAHSDFNIDDLLESISAIKKLINSNEKYRKQFIKSLNKILALKSNLLEERRIVSADINDKMFWPKDGSAGFSSYDDYLNNVFDASVVHLSNGNGKKLNDLLKMDRKAIFASSDTIDEYKKLLGAEFAFEFSSISREQIDKDFNAEKKRFQKLVSDNDLVVFSVINVDHANILDSLRLKKPSLLERVVVFLHGSPHLINEQLINSVTIYGNFSRDIKSFASDVRVMRGDVTPKPLKYLTVSLGNGSIHNDMNTIEPTEWELGLDKLLVFNTEDERRLHASLEEMKNKLDKSIKELSDARNELVKYKEITLGWDIVAIPALLGLISYVALCIFTFSGTLSRYVSVMLSFHSKFIISLFVLGVYLVICLYYYSSVFPEKKWIGYLFDVTFRKLVG
ncbi:glycoside hydrolase family 3 N-terminal domain-containing protein [Plesiomonas shigelloides]|uniref:glycoside hydrolase family 3 N-terminal domain-containing protein n=1 Tax=Plesiomonas shigelloides TaxID=703 RepID=UPI001C5B554E|nr:glycoside hydrolase family 3 N-terminal domain-containing protein [Plesiomonas shigelloides]MBW3794430.1 hypothetical protein [Plesiomonas shigelloides]